MALRVILLIDFGSTYTKVTAVDLEAESLIGTAAAYSTVESDISEGLQNAMRELEFQTGRAVYEKCYACSSAAGGLRMAASGLVPALTAEAARIASLGAGAKVVKVYSYQLIDEDISEIDLIRPDIFLLSGGTDSGNRDCILHNAEMLAGCKDEFPILIAGNRSCTAECERILTGREVYRCENVMPQLGKLNTEPVQEQIRELFLRRIIQAKGLSKAAELVHGILMPTPSAVLCAMRLLAEGTKSQPGLGELVAVDLGGATTDVYSMTEGIPENGNTILKGLPEPFAKRTVEGDLGMRYSANGVLAAVGAERIASLAGMNPIQINDIVMRLGENPDMLPSNPEWEALDFALASAAIETAVMRHAGTIEEVYTPTGKAWVQTGKDLTRVEKLVVTGGAVIHNRHTAKIATHALFDPARPEQLRPKTAKIFVDRKYILSAMGLLGEQFPNIAMAIMKKELETWNL